MNSFDRIERQARLAAIFFFLVLILPNALAQGIYARWINRSGGTVPESAIGATIDAGTNVFVLGRFYGFTNKVGTTTLTNSLGTSNLFIFEFKGSSTVAPIWAVAPVTDYPISNARIKSDFTSGGIYVAGNFGGTNLSFGGTSITNYATFGNNSEDVFIARFLFTSTGNLAWLMHIGGETSDSLGDMAMELGFHPASFYVTGSFQSTNFVIGNTNLLRQSTSGSDCYTAKFGLNGNLVWIGQGTYASGDYIAVDISNNCYVAGKIVGATAFGNLSPSNQITTNYVTKYDSNGTPVWSRGDLILGNHIGVDRAQCIYTAGTFSNVLQIGNTTLSNSSPSTIFLAKYDPSGNPVWAQPLPGLGYDGLTGIAFDRLTNCWISGYFASTNQIEPQLNSIAFVACFDQFGNPLAFSQAGGTSSVASGITVDINVSPQAGNICVFGSFSNNFSIANKPLTNAGNADIFASLLGLGPQVKTTVTSTNLVLSWPAVVENNGFVLQAITNFGSTNWNTIGSGSSINGQMVFTNKISGNAQFFRLAHP